MQITITLNTESEFKKFYDFMSAAQPEVANNTGSTAPVALTSEPFPGGSVVTASPDTGAEASQANAASGEADVKAKRTRKPKEEVAAPTGETVEPPTTSGSVAPAAETVTLDDVRAALQAYTVANSLEAGLALLKEFSAGRISELDADKYADFVARCNG